MRFRDLSVGARLGATVLLVLTAITTLSMPVPPEASAAAPNRVSGADRYATSVGGGAPGSWRVLAVRRFPAAILWWLLPT